MSFSSIQIASPLSLAELPLPASILQTLASRVRDGGLLLAVFRPDDTTPAFVDPENTSPFFTQYARLLLERLTRRDPAFLTRARTPASSAALSEVLPGLYVTAIPHVERRQASAILLLIAKRGDFSLNEDVLRACSQLQLDSTWLAAQAQQLPGYAATGSLRQTDLLAAMLHDQLRLSSVEHELNSLSGQLANTYEELTLIYQISSGMRINRRASEFFKQACIDVLDVMSLTAMGVALDAAEFHVIPPVLYGPHSVPDELAARLGQQLLEVCRQRKSVFIISDLSKDPSFSWLAPHAKQLIAVPLQRQDQVLGCLFGLDKTTGDFDSVDAKLLNSISNEAAIYLENAVLFDDVHGLMMGLLHSLTSAVDAKDAYTCGHSERVALLSRYLAQAAGLSEHDVERIYMAGLLHDVGKIGVPEAVLQKPGKLDDAEFALMKKHPEIGARILRDIKQIADIIPGVMYHHERYDGRGYPHNLSGENIPLMGRIICLADCFDAMTSNRTYRKALSLETALDEIRKGSGTQFDPTLAATFLAMGPERLQEILSEHTPHSLAPLMATGTAIPAENPHAH